MISQKYIPVIIINYKSGEFRVNNLYTDYDGLTKLGAPYFVTSQITQTATKIISFCPKVGGRGRFSNPTHSSTQHEFNMCVM